MSRILPVILCGGAGSRLWPVSSSERPKQFQRIIGEHTMLQATALRVADPAIFDPPLMIANERHREVIEAQLAEVGLPSAAFVLEPVGRNTAPAIALAALSTDPDALLLVLPSDHAIDDVAAFHSAIQAAVPLAVDDWLVTFGIQPSGPETGYGYIKRAAPLGPFAFVAERFVEKPDRVTAKAYLASGDYDWNGGIFLMRAKRYLDELGHQSPEILADVRAAMAAGRREGHCIYPGAREFAAAPAISIDYAVMEKAERVALVPVAMGWSDVGSWDALYDIATKDSDGNVVQGNGAALSTHNCLIRSDGPTVVAVGVQDLIVVATADAVIVVPRGDSQRVREALDAFPRLQSAEKDDTGKFGV